ncbi:GntR family transcriptional regulator [Streptomyces sp. NPDC087440]|uniref:GntR family transcriptional regulator n=1 Tax=Streptomyces sp. NPDC087440 TaxID=3365790 RepID=UPI0037F781CD
MTATLCQTAVGRTTATLRARIASGVYPPASTLPLLHSLAAELGVGMHSLHEALGRLAAEGLIQRGGGSSRRPVVRAEPVGPSPVARVAQLVRDRVKSGAYVAGQEISPHVLASEGRVSWPVADQGCAWARQEGYLRGVDGMQSQHVLWVCEPDAYALPEPIP